MDPSKSHGRVFGLDVMRAVAIALVLLDHFLLLLRLCYPGGRGWSVMAGYFGVEIFFVLSGFLIGGILIRDFHDAGASAATLSRFWCRRWLRTLPLFYLFVGLNLAINASVVAPSPDWWKHLLFLQNFHSPAGPFFVEAWSLAVEEWFYLLAPVFIFALVKTGLPLKRAVLYTAAGGIICATAWRMHIVATGHPDWLSGSRSVVTMRLDACMYGVLAAWWAHYAPASWNTWRCAKLLAGLLCLFAAGTMFRFLPLNTSFAARTHLFTLTSLGAMLCLPALAALRAAPGKWALGITCLSQWSYALYLVNFPIFMWLWRRVAYGFLHPEIALSTAAGGVVLSILVAAALHYLFERPILRWRDRHVRAQQPSVEKKEWQLAFNI